MIPNTYKWHPQPSSLRKATQAARIFGVKDMVVLDCFNGTGTHCIAALSNDAGFFIGTDIEDYDFCLRSGMKNIQQRDYRFEKGIDAIKSVVINDYNVLFIDPPNPYQIAGGSLPSVVRDTGLSGSGIAKFWGPKFSKDNVINKKQQTIDYVKEVVRKAIVVGKARCLVNLFSIRSNKFDYLKTMGEFDCKQIYESYYEVS